MMIAILVQSIMSSISNDYDNKNIVFHSGIKFYPLKSLSRQNIASIDFWSCLFVILSFVSVPIGDNDMSDMVQRMIKQSNVTLSLRILLLQRRGYVLIPALPCPLEISTQFHNQSFNCLK